MGKYNALLGWTLVALMAMAGTAFSQDVLELETNAKKVNGKNLKCEITPFNNSEGKLGGLKYACTNLLQGSISYAEIASSKGAVLYAEGDREVIKVRLAVDFDPKSDGSLTLDYLRNGMSDTRQDFTMFAYQNAGEWFISESKGGANIAKLCMKKNSKFLIGTVGISSVQPAESDGECHF